MSDEDCMAVCRECTQQIGKPAVQPFGSRAGLDAWWAAHVRNCPAHDVRPVIGWHAPHVALYRAFGEGPL